MLDIGSLRLISQSVAQPRFAEPEAVVRALGAIQAQDYGQALWAIGLRTKGAKLGDVLLAIESGRILRTWPMRGTIHFVSAEDAGWMVSLVAQRMLRSATSRYSALGLSEKDFRKAEQVLREALTGHKRLTRPALMKLLQSNSIPTSGQRGYHILWTLSLEGVLCIGPMEDKQQTFVLLEEWAPHPRRLTHEEGLGVLAERYFTSHGPATVSDFATWSGQPLRDAKLGLEIAKGALISEDIKGASYWMTRDMPAIGVKSVRATYLLAGFDEYLLGYKDRSAVVAPERAIASNKNGIFFPIIVSRGQVVGTWKRTLGRRNITVSVAPFEPLPAETLREVAHQIESYGQFMGLPVVRAAKPASYDLRSSF